MKSISVAIDHFGIAGNDLIQTILNQSSNVRARKIAFNNLFRLAKASGLIPRKMEPLRLAITINQAGTQRIEFLAGEAYERT